MYTLNTTEVHSVAYVSNTKDLEIKEDKTNTLLPTDKTNERPLVAYTLKIRGGREMDSNGKKAGKGALIQKDLSATLGVSQDQYLFQPMVANSSGGGISGTLDASYYKGQGERQGAEREYVVCKKLPTRKNDFLNGTKIPNP